MINILITGAGSGVGAAIAQSITAKINARLFLVGRNSERLQQTILSVRKVKADAKAEAIVADVSLTEGIDKIISEVQKHTGTLEIVLHCAGKLIKGSASDLTMADYMSVYGTNVFGPAILSGRLLPFLKKGQLDLPSLCAHVIHISSMGGVQGSMKFAGLSAYSSSKAAVIGLTECLAEEWGKEKIHVNALAIGSVETEMFREAFPDLKAATQASEMGNFIADFALTAGRLMNGKTVQVSASTP